MVHGYEHKPSRKVWLKLAAVHSFGAITSGAAVGTVLAIVAWIVDQPGVQSSNWAYWSALFTVLVYLPRQLGWTRFPPLLQSTWQVPQKWAKIFPPWLTALLFGIGLGSGLFTRIIVPTFYLLLIWPFLELGFLFSIVMWSTYGFIRSCNVWWLACRAPVGNFFPYANQLTFALLLRAKWMYRANTTLLLMVLTCLLAWRYFS